MSHNDARIRALRQVTQEARSAPRPEPDWDAVEERLFARLPEAAPVVAPRPWGRVAVVATATAAAIAAAVALAPRHRDTAPVAKAPASTSHVYGPGIATLDGSSLAVGDRVVARDHAIVVTEPGHAVWTLAAHSSASMADTGRYMTVRLETGSVAVAVVPRHVPESFAIEVEQTRVAAHGTHFKVERAGDRAKVVLDEGVVAVGAAGDRGRTHGFIMEAPSTGSFSLDGAKTGEVDGPAPAAPSVREPVAVARTPRPARAASALVKPLPDAPGTPELDRGATRVMSLVEKCFVDNTEAAGGVSISVLSTLDFTVTPTGKVADLRSDPPLAPPVLECTNRATDKALFPASQRGAKVTRTLHLAK